MFSYMLLVLSYSAGMAARLFVEQLCYFTALSPSVPAAAFCAAEIRDFGCYSWMLQLLLQPIWMPLFGLLQNLGGAAFPSEKTARDCSSSDISSLKINTGSGKTEKTKLTLFSGFVSYQMVRDANEAGKSGFGSLLSLGHSPGKTERIHMKGPGGRGEVEVAVSRVVGLSAGVIAGISIAGVAGVLLLAVCIYVGVYKKKKVQDKILLSARSEHQLIQAARAAGSTLEKATDSLAFLVVLLQALLA